MNKEPGIKARTNSMSEEQLDVSEEHLYVIEGQKRKEI
jgi:hypothetical protein